ncbi:MAG: hypothetical protein ACRD3M_03085 [Thermoanaerobaculia bacterium]
MSSRARVLVFALVGLALLPALLSACPLCKDALEDRGGAPNQLGKGFYYSILLMMSAPFLLVSGLFFKIYLARRRQRRLGESAAPSLLPEPPGARS